jgi:MoxR-like ATPase
LVPAVCGHRLALVRQTSDALEERNAVAVALRRIVGAIPLPV